MKKDITCAVDSELWELFRSVVRAKGIRIQTALDQALRDALEKLGVPDDQPPIIVGSRRTLEKV